MAAYPEVKLGDVLEHRKEFIEISDLKEYKRCRVQLHAKGIILRDKIAGSLIKTKKQQIVRHGELLVAEIDAKVGGFGIVPVELGDAIVSSHYFLFQPIIEKLDERYLGYYIKTPAFRGQVNAQGSTNYAAIRPSHVQDYTIPLPPLDEQRRIVARIDELVEHIGLSINKSGNSKLDVDSLLGNTIYELFTTFQQNKGHSTKISDYAVSIRYGSSEKAVSEPIGIPLLRMGNIQNGALSVQDLKYLAFFDEIPDGLILQKGDVLINRTNSAELVGKCAVFELEGTYGYASYIIRLRLDSELALPELVAYYINSPIGREYMFSKRKQMTGQANVNAKTLMAMPISLPSMDEQRRIVEHLDALQAKVDEVKRLQAQVQTELDALLPSILDRAFKGEL